MLRAEGTVATWQVPVTVDGEWWGFVGIDLCTERPWTDETRPRRARAGRRAVGIGRRAAGGRGRAAARRSVPLHRRGRARRHVHRRDRRQRVVDLRQPADRGAARLRAAGVVRRSRAVAAGAASRRSRSRARGERAPQRDGRAVPPGVPDVREGRARRMGARRRARRPRRPRHAAVLARRDDRHLRTQAHRGGGRVPGVSRRAHRAPVARDVRGAPGAVRRRARGATTGRSRCSASI